MFRGHFRLAPAGAAGPAPGKAKYDFRLVLSAWQRTRAISERDGEIRILYWLGEQMRPHNPGGNL